MWRVSKLGRLQLNGPRARYQLQHPSSSQDKPNFQIFDRYLKGKQRDRAAWLMSPTDNFLDTVAERLLDRLEDCKKDFSTALCLGGSIEPIRRLLRGRGGIERLIMMDMSPDMIKKCRIEEKISDPKIETLYVVGDEEFLPIKQSSLDLIISCLGLHWVNDLPGAMIQCKSALKPDGMFLVAILGGETLRELRIACTVAQMEREGGISPRISPLAQVALELIEHLRSIGETNALLQRNHILKRDTALATAAIYQSMFGAEDGTIPATFQVIYMTGWAPHPSQQKAKKRGSANVSFEDIQREFGNQEAP
ncbi:putative methyltransferase At1g22800, mitochondrial isoform X2 [Cryptomeria japonica]|uniref:putative methyltransferase At1g22800, mitochondrial isoform X2 n=1 Tax=Cryptomeria japonica TaxID=3369 RepID=UPI0027DAB123|nr:putative methyltransferase At1g22800, mitochondrial isoform X2 [Cryptomeria japonica]